MIGYLKGVVTHLNLDSCFLNVQGVGYRVFLSEITRQKLVLNEEAMLFTYLNVREDALLLYGFAKQEEYEVFLALISVNGVGPKLALAVLSTLNPQELYFAIEKRNTVKLLAVSGVGKKMAERLVLELKGKLPSFDFIKEETDNKKEEQISSLNNSADLEALEALMALGYQRGEVLKVLTNLEVSNQDVGTVIKLALRELSKGAKIVR